MTVAPQADQEIVQGVVQGILDKGQGKWQVEVNVGQQNPRRLWTKDATLVAQLAMAIGQQLAFFCGVSTWTNQQGQPVRSLWINGVGQPGQQPQVPVQPAPWPQQPQPMAVPPQPMPVQAPLPQPAAQMLGGPLPGVTMQEPRISEAEREKRIHRQTATKVSAMLISHVPADQRTVENLIILSERLVAYYEHGVPQNEPVYGGGNPGAYGDGPPHTDDDIPF